jgi:multidrug efflux pump subunit AcrB/outer membrane protein TolC
MKKSGIVESAMRYRKIVFLITALLVILGIYGLFVMPRQEFPTFTIRQGLVIAAYPGATSKEVEEQVTNKVENYLFGYKEIKKRKTYSYSKDGLMIIFVELNDEVKNSDEFWSKLNHGLNTFKSELPSGVLALFTNSDFGDTSALLITLEADHKSYRELEKYMDELENRLRRIQSVSKIRHYGLEKEQISIYLEKDKLTNYGISSTTLMANLFTQGFTTSGGSIDNEHLLAPIHIAPSYNSEQELGEQIIYSDPSGNIIRLKDVARIVREYPNPDDYVTNNNNKCLLISMEMQRGNNIVQYGKEVDGVLKEFQSELPDGVKINRVADQPKVVSDSISTFMKEMLYAIIAVILVTMLLLPLRVASVAATSIPISIFTSLGVMLLCGIELNTVTLAALIVVLGMIVDNSIVIVDSYMEKLDHGMSRWHAAISSAKGFFKAIFSATLAISITFFPFLFTMKGIMQEFVQLFPWTVTITLGISLLVAMLLIPFLQYSFIKNGFEKSKRIRKNNRRNFLDIIQETYEKWLVRAFRHPRITMGLAFSSIALGVLLFMLVPQRLMPIAERDQFAVEIYLPQGSSLKQTAAVADSMENILKKDKRVLSITSFIGTSSPRFHTTYAPNLPAKNYAQFIVNTPSNKETVELLDIYTAKYAEYFPNAHIRFKQLDYQEAAFPIEIRLVGNDLAQIKTKADTLVQKFRKVKGLTWVHTNYEEILPGANVEINQTEANRLGISRTTVATNLAVRFSDIPLTTMWEGNYPVVVKLKAEREKEANFSDIENEYIHSLIPGVSVPLRQIANVTPDWNEGKIVRRNGVRTISILGDVERGYNINKVFSEVRKITEKENFPQGMKTQYGGSYETDQEDLPMIIGGLIASMFIIFFILLFHFRKINLALLVLGSSSLSFLGAVIGILILGLEFSLTSILGVVSLVGILVRNGIIMLDYAEELRHRYKKTVLEAAFEAGKRRMRPIFLTSAAASMGVIPMIMSKSALWSPMGTVICFGTLTSMVLLVLILPVSYWLIFRKVDKTRSKITIDEITNKGITKPAILTIMLLFIISPALLAQKSYTLNQCKELALKNNALVKNKQIDINASEETKKATFTKYFPKVNSTVLGFKVNKPMLEFDVPSGNLPVYDGNLTNLANATQFAYFPGMSISALGKGAIVDIMAVQPVYAGRQITTGNKLAALGVEVSQLQLQVSKDETALETEKQYLALIALKEKMKTLNKFILMVDTLHKEVNDALKSGLITRNDLLKVELKQNELQTNKLKLENGITLSKMALCQHIGIVYDDNIDFSDSLLVVTDPKSIHVNHQDALVDRSEYKLLKKSTEAEKYQTKIQRGEYMPQVGIGVDAQYLNIGTGSGSTYGTVFGSISIPISDWWEASHKLKERRLKEEQNQNMVTDNTEKLLLQMQQALNTLDEAYQQIKLATVAIKQARENLKITTDNFHAGMIQVSDVLEAQALYQSTNDNLTNSKCDYQVAVSKYLQTIGKYK